MTAEHFPTEDLDPADHEDYPHHLSVEEAQALADAYCIDNETMRVCKEEFDLAHDEWMAFRQVHSLRHAQPTVVDPDKSIEEAANYLTQRQKRQATERKAKRKHRRARDRAARQWWHLEETLAGAADRFRERSYDPPRPTVRLSQRPADPAALLVNAQDWHVGKRPKDAREGWMRQYIKSLKDAFASGIEKAVRSHKLEKLYLITGGDLIHVDNAQGSTTSGTPQDVLCSPTEALEEAIALLVWCIDYARALGVKVHVVVVQGNHDRVLSAAAGMALQHRFHAAEEVMCPDPAERVYLSYEEHLILATHGDMKKRQWRKLPSIMLSEARNLLASTRWQTVVSGHLHFQAADVEDESGTLYAQGSSPSPTDAWHHRSGYVGSRKGIQFLLMEPDTAATNLMHEPV